MSAARTLPLIPMHPVVRRDCEPGVGLRPCPWTDCRYHLGPALLVVGRESCTLDAADRGGMTIEEVGDALGIDRERAKQIEEKARRKVVSRWLAGRPPGSRFDDEW